MYLPEVSCSYRMLKGHFEICIFEYKFRSEVMWWQVVLAVDDSRSMAENGCGGFALEAVTLLARALARLEVGQLGVLRFGGTDHVRLLHALDAPFTDANGPAVLSALRFDQVLCHAKLIHMPLSRRSLARFEACMPSSCPAFAQLSSCAILGK